jgi:CheY-like chemotaxis protein
VPVVMVTSHDGEARIDGIRAGADDFVTKPFDQQELLLRVRVARADQALPRHDSARRAAELAEWNRTLEGRGGGAGRRAREDGAVAPLPLADACRGRDGARRKRPREPPARASRPVRRPARLDGLQQRHGAGGGDERRRLVPRRDGRADPQVRGDGWLVRGRRADGVVQRPDPVRRPGRARGADGVEMRNAMSELTAAWRKARPRARLLPRVALGYATIGRIGFDGSYDYGAVGSVLNLASRLATPRSRARSSSASACSRRWRRSSRSSHSAR